MSLPGPARRHAGAGRGSANGRESRLAERLLRQRSDREALLGRELGSEPVWTMLLTLLVADEEARSVPLAELCARAGAPQATAARWAATMAEEGMVEVVEGEVRLEAELAGRIRTLLRSWIGEDL